MQLPCKPAKSTDDGCFQAQCVLENAAAHRVWFPRKELLNENAIREVANLAHRGVLSELLDLALAANAIDPAVSGAGQFARRYGFRDKPLRVRFRLLDPRRGLLPTATDQDLTVTHDTFAQLNPNVARVFITENEINFLAFPQISDSLVLSGAGYGFDMLAHRPQWGKEPQPVLRDLTRLDPRERALFADLRDQRLGQKDPPRTGADRLFLGRAGIG